MTTLRHSLLTALSALLLSAPLAAQGLSELDAERYARVPVWQPGDLGEMRSPTPCVDLRHLLHAPGQQGRFGSCTGWALAEMKTAQETIDQQWRPDAAQRIFSPAYIWCQLNGGANRGTSLLKGLELLRSQGCCTWDQMPYQDREALLRAPITPAARAQARQFRIASFARLPTLTLIKEALAQGNVVVVGIRTDPHFMGGSWSVWTPALRRAGAAEARRQGGSAMHARHAALIVGYDDSRRACLLYNSWGTGWNKGGCAWISYDLLQRVPNAPEGDGLFIEQAWLAHDVRSPIGGPPTPTPERLEVGLRLFSRYLGRQGGQPLWSVYASLRATPATLAALAEVSWTFPGPDGRPRVRRVVDGAAGFALNVQLTRPGRHVIQAALRSRRGSTGTLSRELTLTAPTPQTSALKLVQTDRYYGQLAGKPTWEWTLALAGSAEDLARVDHVTYELHPTFTERTPVARNRHDGFALTRRGWGTFKVGATAHFVDGGSQRLEHQLRFTSPRDDTLRLTNSSQFVGWNAGRRMWAWTARIEGPVGTLRAVKQVSYQLHPTFHPATRVVASEAEDGFPLSTYGWGTFELRALVTFGDGSQRQLTHELAFVPSPAASPDDGPPHEGDPPRKGDPPSK